MHNTAFIILIFIAFMCGGDEKTKIEDPVIKPELRPDQVIIPAPQKIEWAFGKGYSDYSPNASDIETAEKLLEECFNKESSGTANPFFERRLEDYNMQFIGASLEGGDKVIMINCFCREEAAILKNWKTEMVLVPDGGNCFFRVTVNLERKSYYNLMVNGYP